jgi:hypothetical protein
VPGGPWTALVLVSIAGVVAGCGRVGYDPVVHSRPETVDSADRDGRGDSNVDRDPEAPRLEPGPDAAAADAPVVDASVADASVDTQPPDAAPADVAGVDTKPPAIDVAPPADSARDVADTGPAAPACLSFPAADMIADFENGTLNTNRVGARGGSPFHMVAPELGTLANVAMSFCGQRAMQLQPIGTPSRAPLAQGHLMPDRANPDEELFDARAYRGIAIALRASTPIAVRLKLPNNDTTSAGNDHFQVSLNVGTEWNQVTIVWTAFKQLGVATQFPTFDVSTLYAVEISASLPPGASLWVDQIAFVR